MFANDIQVSVVDTPKDKVSLPGITSIFADPTASVDSLYATRRPSDASPTSDPGSSSGASRPNGSPPTISSHYHPSTPNAPTLLSSSSYPHPSSSERSDSSNTLEYDNWDPTAMTTPRERGPPPPYSASAPPPQTPISATSGGGALYPHPHHPKSPSQDWNNTSNNTLVVVPPAATPPSVSYPSLPPGPPPSDLPNGNGAAASGVQPPRRRGKLPKQVTETLRTWLMAHSDHPYPTEDEKKMLCNATGLSISQVSNWMINARRRILVPANKALGPATPYNIAHRPSNASGLSLNTQHHLSSNPYPSHYPRPSYSPNHDPSLRSTSYGGNNNSPSNSLTLYPPNHSTHLPLPHQNSHHLQQQQHDLSHHNPIRSSSYALGSAGANTYNNYPLRSVPFSGAQGNTSHHHHPSYNLSTGSQALGGYPGVTPTGLPLLSTPLATVGYGSGAATGAYGGTPTGTITLMNPSSATNGSSGNGEVTQPSGPQGSSRFY